MDIRKIEAFAKVFEHKSFSKAGKSLYLSQPTISAHVASLEQELGVILFDRIGRTVVPTCAGEILYMHAQRIFDASELALSEIRKLQERVTGKLDVGGSTIPANYILPEYLAEFWRMYPEVVMDLRVGDSEEIISAVRDNSLMLGVVGNLHESTDLVFEPIVQDCLVLVMAPHLSEKYARLESAEFLRAVPWVMREEGSGTREAMERSLAKFHLPIQTLNVSIIVRNAASMARCARAGMGAAITSAITVTDSVQDGSLVTVDLPGLNMDRSFYVVYNKRRSLFPAALKLIEYLKSNIRPFVPGLAGANRLEHASSSRISL